MKNRFIKIVPLLLICLGIGGCAPIITGAAVGIAATVAVYDHKAIKGTMEDHNISKAILSKLQANTRIAKQCHIEVSSYHGTVLLVGQAPTPFLKNKAEELAQSVPNIKRLYNELTIEGPTSFLTRTSDSWITTKVKSRLLATKGLRAERVKVLTEDSTVFLIGITNRSQADLAVRATRQVKGVEKVVKVFQYTSE